MNKLYFLGLCLLLLSSCTITRDKCNQLYPPVVTHTVDTFLQVRETILHDTTYVPAESSEMELYFEADVNNDVQVTKAVTKNGKRSNIAYTTERNNRILTAMFKCNCDSLNIYHVFKDLDTTLSVKNTEVQINTVNVPAKLTWWQQFKVDYGGYLMGLVALYLFLRVGFWALKTYTSIQLPWTKFL